MKKLKVGDTVIHRGGFGYDAPKKAKIEGIEVNTHGSKEGDDVDECNWSEVTRDNCVVSLDNGHWAYGSQVKPV